MQLEITLTTLVLIASACMFFGYFFGLFEGRRAGYRKRKKEEEAEAATEEAPTEEAAPEPEPAPLPAPVIRDDPGLLRLREANGQLQVDLDGAPLAMDALAADQRKRLIELITRLRPWVEGRSAAPEQPAPAPPIRQPAQTAPLTPPPPPPPPVRPVAAPAVSAATPSATTPKKAEPPAAPQTMVAQIDAILQERIENTPLNERGIKLEEAPGGAVNVVVGNSRYAGIGEVPDPEVQAAIRAAIAEWERKFTPG
jgi:hypothetical protein